MTPFKYLEKSAARGDQAAQLIKAITTRAKSDRFGVAGEALAGGVNELAKVNIGHLPAWYRFNRGPLKLDEMQSSAFKGFNPEESGGVINSALRASKRGDGESSVLATLIKAWRGGKAAPGLDRATPHSTAPGSGLLQGLKPRVKSNKGYDSSFDGAQPSD